MKPSNCATKNFESKLNSADSGKEGVIIMNFSRTISSQEHEVVSYHYKLKKQKSKNKPTCYLVQQYEIAEKTFSRNRLTLYKNFTDDSNYVVIKFYLPEPAETELILMDSEKREALCFINERLEAGNHTYKTEIRNEELSRFTYYYKLNVNGNSEVRKMEYVSKS